MVNESHREREDEQVDLLTHIPPEQRELTGSPHLDSILGGGLPRGALTLILGLPGSGKTTLASQIMFNAARAGKSALILTALSESTTKLIGHLASYHFFDRSLIGGRVKFLSMQQVWPQGLQAVAEATFAEVRRIKANYVLLDGFRGLSGVGSESQTARQFLYEVGTTLNTLGVTTVLTSETDPRDPNFYPETTTADVIIGLHYTLQGVRQHRGIEIIKSRGSASMAGMHSLVLDDHGATVYPQLEERILAETSASASQKPGKDPRDSGPACTPEARAIFDLPEFDMMLRGGIPRGTCTVLAGSLGTGKTLLALSYALAGVGAGEPVVFLGFRENERQLRQVLLPFGLGAEFSRALEPGGLLTLLDMPPIKLNADILADRLLLEVDRTHARRVIIDSEAELERAVLRGLDPHRLEDYLAALLQALRSRNVTTLMLKETDKVVAASLDLSADALSILSENVILLQHIPYLGHLHRILSILKLRFSDHDTAIREFRIRSPKGIEVLEPFESAQGVLDGIARGKEPGSKLDLMGSPNVSQPGPGGEQ